MIVSIFVASATDQITRLCLGILFFHCLIVAEQHLGLGSILVVGKQAECLAEAFVLRPVLDEYE